MPKKIIKKKRSMDPAVIAKGQEALAAWRKERDLAKRKGGRAWEDWQTRDAIKKAQRKTTPMQAIKNFCNECVGGIRDDITKCSAYNCPLYLYRPYQIEGSEE